MPYTYPPAPATLAGDVESINRYLLDLPRVARDLRTLLQQRYISDAILSGRYEAVGGAILYETGEPIFATDNPQAVPPGGEYPLTTLPGGTASVAKTAKWGEDAEITDESIARQRMDPVRVGLLKLVNQNVRYVDSVALSAVASAVTAAVAAAAPWVTATAAQILRDVMLAKANIVALNQGYDPDTVVVDDISYAYALSTFIAAGYLPREAAADNPLMTGDFPVIQGMRWLATPNLPTAGQVLVLDSQQLGGMADEKLGGPGYVGAGDTGTAPVEVKTIREDYRDQWRIRCRRVTVPVVKEPAAARKITGI